MKLPTPSTGATAPSGSSFFGTNPGVFGSRVGGVGRGAAAGAWAAGWPTGGVWVCAEIPCANVGPDTTANSASENTVLIEPLLMGLRRPGVLSDSQIVRQSPA